MWSRPSSDRSPRESSSVRLSEISLGSIAPMPSSSSRISADARRPCTGITSSATKPRVLESRLMTKSRLNSRLAKRLSILPGLSPRRISPVAFGSRSNVLFR